MINRDYRTRSMIGRLLLVAVCFEASLGRVANSAPTLSNGSFEKTLDGRPVDWELLGPGVTVKPFTSAAWKHSELVVNSAEYNVIRVFLGVQKGTGIVWFDNVAVDESDHSRLVVVNMSFEEGDANTLTGWGQDGAGDRSFRDTTTWARFPGQAFGSGASARVVGSDGSRNRIWQDVGRDRGKKYPFRPGVPNSDYVISFDWRAEDLQGEVLVEAYGVEADGQLGRALPIRPLATRFPPEQFGQSVVELSLSSPGETGLSQRLKLSSADRTRAWRVRRRCAFLN